MHWPKCTQWETKGILISNASITKYSLGAYVTCLFCPSLAHICMCVMVESLQTANEVIGIVNNKEYL